MAREIPNKGENEQLKNLGIFEETAPLKRVIMWGRPGVECALAQLLLEKDSCFHEQFNVAAAREEFSRTLDLLREVSPKTEIILVKDLLAQAIRRKGVKPSSNLSTLLKRLNRRADEFYLENGIGNLDKVKEWMHDSLSEDKKKYGEDVAVVMNERLANLNGLPMANVLYARDQSNLAGKAWIWSSMKRKIRQPEVELYREALEKSGILGPDIKQIQVKGDGRFEGGDLIVSNGICYVGVGGRTNMEGIKQIAHGILEQGLRLVVAYDEERDKEVKPEMDAMHFDTIAMPASKDMMVICPPEIERRQALEITENDGNLNIHNLGKFSDFLKREEIEPVEITKEEQENYAPNFLNLGYEKVVLSLAKGNNLTQELSKKGKQALNADLTNITKGYGGLHCMTSAVERG